MAEGDIVKERQKEENPKYGGAYRVQKLQLAAFGTCVSLTCLYLFSNERYEVLNPMFELISSASCPVTAEWTNRPALGDFSRILAERQNTQESPCQPYLHTRVPYPNERYKAQYEGTDESDDIRISELFAAYAHLQDQMRDPRICGRDRKFLVVPRVKSSDPEYLLSTVLSTALKGIYLGRALVYDDLTPLTRDVGLPRYKSTPVGSAMYSSMMVEKNTKSALYDIQQDHITLMLRMNISSTPSPYNLLAESLLNKMPLVNSKELYFCDIDSMHQDTITSTSADLHLKPGLLTMNAFEPDYLHDSQINDNVYIPHRQVAELAPWLQSKVYSSDKKYLAFLQTFEASDIDPYGRLFHFLFQPNKHIHARTMTMLRNMHHITHASPDISVHISQPYTQYTNHTGVSQSIHTYTHSVATLLISIQCNPAYKPDLHKPISIVVLADHSIVFYLFQNKLADMVTLQSQSRSFCPSNIHQLYTSLSFPVSPHTEKDNLIARSSQLSRSKFIFGANANFYSAIGAIWNPFPTHFICDMSSWGLCPIISNQPNWNVYNHTVPASKNNTTNNANDTNHTNYMYKEIPLVHSSTLGSNVHSHTYLLIEAMQKNRTFALLDILKARQLPQAHFYTAWDQYSDYQAQTLLERKVFVEHIDF